MKIIWLCNIILPVIAKELGRKGSVVGGWLSGIYDKIGADSKLELGVCFPDLTADKVYQGTCGKTRYWGFPQTRKDFTAYNAKVEAYFYEIVCKEQPDIIHIFGTEFPHTAAMVNACERAGMIDRVIISIQGLVSVYAGHYYTGVPKRIVNSYTFRDFVRHDNLRIQAENFVKRGIFEKQAVGKVKHVIGRTDFDKACVLQMNPDVNYYHCNENMRSVFYSREWSYEDCEKHSVFFVNQSNYPIKGIHYVLEAVSVLKEKYPDIKVYTTGDSPLANQGIKDKLRQGSFNRFVTGELQRRGLQDNIVFCGALDEEQMVKRYLEANCFLLPSTIENSPNSLGEAMLLGLPCVAADVGGVKNMLVHDEEGYVYQPDAPYMMAYYIDKVFEMGAECKAFSQKARLHAQKTHDAEVNNEKLFAVYQQVINSAKGEV